MGKGITNVELLQRARSANGEAEKLFRQLIEEPPPATALDLYALVKRLRNHARSSQCAVQELKNRIREKLVEAGLKTAKNAENTKQHR